MLHGRHLRVPSALLSLLCCGVSAHSMTAEAPLNTSSVEIASQISAPIPDAPEANPPRINAAPIVAPFAVQRFPAVGVRPTGNDAAFTARQSSDRRNSGYVVCDGCSVMRKLQNAFFGEMTTPRDTGSLRSGPVVGGSGSPANYGVTSVSAARTVAARRVGTHLLREFVLQNRTRSTGRR
jgi:hypothetical protein